MTGLSLRLIALVVFAAAAGPAAAAPNTGGSTSMPAPKADPAVAYREGVAALEAKDYRKAEQKFAEVLRAAPRNPEANYYMGVAKVGRGQAKASVRYFERAVKERSNFTEARERLALVQIELGDAAAARAQLDALKAQAEACHDADCGGAYAERLSQAIARVEAALETPATAGAQGAALFLAPASDGGNLYRAAARLINEARYKDAIADLYGAQTAIGPHPDILNYLGYAHRKLGRFAAARDYYAQALAIDPGHLGANEYLGELYLETGEVELARRQLARLEALCPFGCAEREDLARLLAIKESLRSAAR